MLAEDLKLALALAEAAAEVALPLFERGVETRDKADGSPVTEADVAVERRLLQLLSQARPADGVLSEESGAGARPFGASGRRWILDPIDGTRWFAAGDATWGTHIALQVEGAIVLGVITRPVAGDYYWASAGQGAHRGALGSAAGERLRVSEIDALPQARAMVWAPPEDPRHALLREHAQHAEPSIDGVLEVASGTLEAVVDAQGELWDMAPAVVLIEEAGGRFSDPDGGRDPARRGMWLTNGRIEPALRGLFA